MKISKITKLLPVALALMLTMPVMAENLAPGDVGGAAKNVDSATLKLDLPAFINITTQDSVKSATATYAPDYSNLTIGQMQAIYQVITNSRTGDAVKLTATAGNTGYNGLRATDAGTMYVVFANTETVPDEQSVESAVSASPASKDNPNAFAVQITEDVGMTANSGATEPRTSDKMSYGGAEVVYPLTNGIYTFTYTFDTKALNETFSTLDTDGDYQAVVTLTQCTAP